MAFKWYISRTLKTLRVVTAFLVQITRSHRKDTNLRTSIVLELEWSFHVELELNGRYPGCCLRCRKTLRCQCPYPLALLIHQPNPDSSLFSTMVLRWLMEVRSLPSPLVSQRCFGEDRRLGCSCLAGWNVPVFLLFQEILEWFLVCRGVRPSNSSNLFANQALHQVRNIFPTLWSGLCVAYTVLFCRKHIEQLIR